MMVPESYTTELKTIKLTEANIDIIVDALKSSPHSIYEYFDYDDLIRKLKVNIPTEQEQELSRCEGTPKDSAYIIITTKNKEQIKSELHKGVKEQQGVPE